MNDELSTRSLQNILARPFIMLEAFATVVLCLSTLLTAPLTYSEELHIDADAQDININSDSGMINRAPMVSSKISLTNLDNISNSINNITDSLNEILAQPIEEEVTAEVDKTKIEEAVKAQPIITKPEKIVPKKIEIAKPQSPTIKPLVTTKKLADKTHSTPVKSVFKAPKTGNQVIAKTDLQKTNKSIINKYLKRDIDGKTLAENSEKWSCVEDMASGLIWEVKSDDGSIHDKNNSYSWFQPSLTNIPQGFADGGKCKGNISCDTQSYTQAVNAQNYCGYSDWRLPTREEMLSIVSLEKNSSTVTINSHYFPDALPSWYWTSSSNEDHPEHAWYVLFRNGIAINDLKEKPKHIRLVRSNKSAQRT
ncbi:MAG: DUF1566 domain-containing protein [Gammaproteobacteria bacterium]|nr:DUF1566 domain-containing protein [Gammaproteobacteria bacterium]